MHQLNLKSGCQETHGNRSTTTCCKIWDSTESHHSVLLTKYAVLSVSAVRTKTFKPFKIGNAHRSIKPKICYIWDKSETKSSVWVHVCFLIISVHTVQWLSKQQQHEVCSTNIMKSTGSACLHFEWPVCCFLVDIMSYWSKSRVLCWPSIGA